MADNEDKVEGPGFTIIDRRISAKESTSEADKDSSNDESKSSVKEKFISEKESSRQDTTSEEIPLPEVDFSSFIISLCTSVFIHLGEIPEPSNSKTSINLPLAKQTIDLIAMLKEKTQGNRTNEEDKLIDEMLYNLRMKFIALSKKAD